MKKTSIIRTYSELMTLDTFEERFKYLQLNGQVGSETFGFDRYINQHFYNSYEWRNFRRHIITRDLGCDLGIEDLEIQGIIIIHHMIPITVDDILQRSDFLMNPEYVICTSDNTHKAIHYGDESLLVQPIIERCANDTCPWKH